MKKKKNKINNKKFIKVRRPIDLKKITKPNVFIIMRETKNNFLVTCVNALGNIIIAFNAGMCGFNGPKKSFPHTAYTCGKEMGYFLVHNNLKYIRLVIKSRLRKKIREAYRGLKENRQIIVTRILKRAPITHNGVRKKKVKRK